MSDKGQPPPPLPEAPAPSPVASTNQSHQQNDSYEPIPAERKLFVLYKGEIPPSPPETPAPPPPPQPVARILPPANAAAASPKNNNNNNLRGGGGNNNNRGNGGENQQQQQRNVKPQKQPSRPAQPLQKRAPILPPANITDVGPPPPQQAPPAAVANGQPQQPGRNGKVGNEMKSGQQPLQQQQQQQSSLQPQSDLSFRFPGGDKEYPPMTKRQKLLFYHGITYPPSESDDATDEENENEPKIVGPSPPQQAPPAAATVANGQPQQPGGNGKVEIKTGQQQLQQQQQQQQSSLQQQNDISFHFAGVDKEYQDDMEVDQSLPPDAKTEDESSIPSYSIDQSLLDAFTSPGWTPVASDEEDEEFGSFDESGIEELAELVTSMHVNYDDDSQLLRMRGGGGGPETGGELVAPQATSGVQKRTRKRTSKWWPHVYEVDEKFFCKHCPGKNEIKIRRNDGTFNTTNIKTHLVKSHKWNIQPRTLNKRANEGQIQEEVIDRKRPRGSLVPLRNIVKFTDLPAKIALDKLITSNAAQDNHTKLSDEQLAAIESIMRNPQCPVSETHFEAFEKGLQWGLDKLPPIIHTLSVGLLNETFNSEMCGRRGHKLFECLINLTVSNPKIKIAILVMRSFAHMAEHKSACSKQ
uniref:BED-type domain-containing protein n=1 Tax=Panagrolaimus davidi TaxID=227884 RepID=A0A914PQJ1_9BILA